MIADVKGDTVVNFTVPYLFRTMYRLTGDADPLVYPVLRITPISPINAPSTEVEPTIFMTLWRAAASDFKFNELKTWVLPTTPALPIIGDTVKAQCDIQTVFKETFSPIIEGCDFARERGVITGEHVTNLRQILKRYIPCMPTLAPSSDPYFNFDIGQNFGQPGFQIVRMYKYWRGSRRGKILYGSANFQGYQAIALNPDNNNAASLPLSNNGMCFTSTPIWNMNEFEIPYYSSLPFIPVDTTSVRYFNQIDYPTGVSITPHTAAFEASFLSAGDDYSPGFLLAPTY